MTKKHNWVTSPKDKYVEHGAHRLAAAFICNCSHLTPAKEAELDNLLSQLAIPEHERVAETCEPDADILAALEELPADRYAWMDEEPPAEAFEFDQSQPLKAASR